MTRDNLPRPNCHSEGKANNKWQAFINTDTRCFKIQKGNMGPPQQGLIIDHQIPYMYECETDQIAEFHFSLTLIYWRFKFSET